MRRAVGSVRRWVEEAERTLDSQSEVTPLTAGQTAAVLRRLLAALGGAEAEHLQVVAVAAALLLRLPHEEQPALMVELVQALLAGLLFLVTSTADTQLEEVNYRVGEVVVQCGRAVVAGVAGSLVSGLVTTHLPAWLRVSWLKTFNLALAEASKGDREVVWAEQGGRMGEVVEVLRTCGNYDTQAAVVELLLR